MNFKEVNKRIKREFSLDVTSQLSDDSLLDEYMKCDSVIRNIKLLEGILENHTPSSVKSQIVQEYLPHLIPAGTKGVIRGNKFNNIVKKFILDNFNSENLEIQFEKQYEAHPMDEIPDWYILNKESNKVIIGMNQLDLWGGGHQLNRGMKYLRYKKIKLVCVVCNLIQFTSNKSKIYKIFEKGFKNNTLCYLGNLKNIITTYLELD